MQVLSHKAGHQIEILPHYILQLKLYSCKHFRSGFRGIAVKNAGLRGITFYMSFALAFPPRLHRTAIREGAYRGDLMQHTVGKQEKADVEGVA